MSTLTLHAPAKLNLSLRVLGKRDDGFHEIDTLMVKLPGLADRLEFSPSGTFSFHCDDTTLPAGEDNLVVKAARAYEAALGSACQHAVTLRKSIPHGAGLAGGSSDAAATLLGLEQLPCSGWSNSTGTRSARKNSGKSPPRWARTCRFSSRPPPRAALAVAR